MTMKKQEADKPFNPYDSNEVREQIREALEAGNYQRAQELLRRINQPPVPSPGRAWANIIGTALFLLFFLWLLIPTIVGAWRFWF